MSSDHSSYRVIICPKMSQDVPSSGAALAPCPCAPWQWHGLLQLAPWRGRSPVVFYGCRPFAEKNGGSGTRLARIIHLESLRWVDHVWYIQYFMLCQLIRKTRVTIHELHELLAITTLINDISMGSFSTTNQLVPRGHDLWLRPHLQWTLSKSKSAGVHPQSRQKSPNNPHIGQFQIKRQATFQQSLETNRIQQDMYKTNAKRLTISTNIKQTSTNNQQIINK